MRLNVELDEQSKQDLLFIQEKTGKTATQIIQELLNEKAKLLRVKS